MAFSNDEMRTLVVKRINEAAYTSGEVPCREPENLLIYYALIDKAASYPASQPYKAAAYRKVAKSVGALDTSLYTWKLWDLENYDIYCKPLIPCSGQSTLKFIYNCIQGSYKNCIRPENLPLYHALLDKADSYSPEGSGKYKAAAYKKMADAVADLTINIFNAFTPDGALSINTPEYGVYLPGGGSTMKFVYDFLVNQRDYENKKAEDNYCYCGVSHCVGTCGVLSCGCIDSCKCGDWDY
jgi:hypothetical protein